MGKNNQIIQCRIDKIFDIDRSGGKSIYTKKYCMDHPGSVPVYAASAAAPLGFVDEADYSGGYLTWARNGLAGYISFISVMNVSEYKFGSSLYFSNLLTLTSA